MVPDTEGRFHPLDIASVFFNLRPVTGIPARSLDTFGHRSPFSIRDNTYMREVAEWHLPRRGHIVLCAEWKVSIYQRFVSGIERRLYILTVLNFKGLDWVPPVNVPVITDGRDKSRSTSSFRIETLEIEKVREMTA